FIGNSDTRNLVGEKLGVADGNQRPDSGYDGDTHVSDLLEKALQLRGVEHGLRDGVFGARVHFPFEALDLVLQIDRRRIDADTDDEAGRFADRVSAGIHSAIEIGDQVRETYRVDIEYRGGVRIGTHLGRIARDEK